MKMIAIISADGYVTAPLAVSLDALRIAEMAAVRKLFNVAVFAPEASPGGGMPVATTRSLADLRKADPAAIILPGLGYTHASEPEAFLQSADGGLLCENIAAAHRDGAWIAASCAASFLPAERGLLDGGRATTSWWLAPQFRARFPQVDLEEGLLTTEHNRVICGGGSLAHIELMLGLLAKFMDQSVVQRVARYMVSPRRGPQSAHASIADIEVQDRIVAGFIAYVRARLAENISVLDAAHAMPTSPRTLERRIRATFGTTPVALIQRIRAEMAIDLLRTTAHPLKWIADQVGYQDENSLRQLLIRATGLTPKAIRRLG